MKVSKNFVKVFLFLFLVVILGNVVASLAGFYSLWMGYILIVFFVSFWFLSFRKSLKIKEDNESLVLAAEWVFVLILLVAVGYLSYFSLGFGSGEVSNYLYDIGSTQDVGHSYLYPASRISDVSNYSNITYRNITASLVYFDVPVISGAKTLIVSMAVLNNFPNNSSKMSLGFGDGSEGNYTNHVVFDSNSSLFANKSKWVNITANFSIANASIFDNHLSILISIPHLAGDQIRTNKYKIPVDWISIATVKN